MRDNVEALISEVDAEVFRLREALKQFADPDNWWVSGKWRGNVDPCDLARRALYPEEECE